ncbi:MAG: DEAD/DEAH box helicase family protein [Selenomonadaceae bacterium]
MADYTQIAPFSHIVPMIYAYTTPQVAAHDGWTKIGYTEKQTVKDRIEQQTHTADVEYHIEWKYEARYSDGSGEYFTDHDFHDYMTTHRGVERKPGTEWFHIDGARSKAYFRDFRDRDYAAEGDEAEHSQYVLREEQRRAVDMTAAYFKRHADDMDDRARSFLWNAKPRFGKTLSTYDLVRRMGAVNVLIVTNRPSIANSWYQDYARFIGWQTGYKFVSETDALRGQPVMSRDDYLKSIEDLSDDETETAGQIAFESLQGLKGSVYFGGDFNKLKWIKDTKWDLLVIDEAHEGVDTMKTDSAFRSIERRFTLHLSGTPFKAIASNKFSSEQIFNWSYEDEQEAKANWDDDAGTNPYARLPRLNMFTYQLSSMIEGKVRKGLDLSEGEHAEYAFDLNEFFSTDSKGRFVHEADVRKFLDALTTNEKFPFSTPELRHELKHTFWLLSRVDSAKAMARMLREHPVFGEYEVVVAAGDGRTDEDDDTANQRSYDKVMRAIKEHERTITLSVGQLTTGVTVKPWTAVLMLSNMKSPAEYMQAAFRAQNPYAYEEGGKLFAKENAYVFDFAPERTLIIYDEFANNLNTDTANGGGTSAEREERIRRLLNFYPVISEDDEGRMVELDAEKVMTIPRSIMAREVVHRGFMSNFLFQNIGNIFSAPPELREMLEKITPADEGGARTNGEMAHADDVSVDEHGDVEIPGEIVISKTRDLFGEKIYEDVGAAVADVIDSSLPDDGKPMRYDTPAEVTAKTRDLAQKVAEAAAAELAPKIETKAKDEYNLTNARTEQLKKSAQREMSADLERLADEHAKQQKIAMVEHEEQLKEAKSEKETKKINNDFDKKLKHLTDEYTKDLKATVEKKTEEITQKVTAELEKRRENEKKKGVEDDMRAHLRGFARTIPSFIMAYSEMAHGGGADLRLSNFDDYTPDDVFLEVTSITEETFRKFRDGCDYVDKETGEKKHYEGHVFNEVVFDEAIKEFLDRKEKLADYFDEAKDEDIFDYIPPQQTNQIFTPKSVVRDMVDALERENPGIFNDPERTFVDFYMKSGLYITEIVKRLYKSKGMKRAYPDGEARLKHILEHQVYGFAPSSIIYDIAMAYIFGFDKKAARISHDNFVNEDVMPYVKEGKLQELVEKRFGKRA